MIKGMTLIREVASDEALDRLSRLLLSLGFEEGKGWKQESSRGAAMLAPLGNLELVAGTIHDAPTILIEVFGLDAVHSAVEQWMQANYRSEEVALLLTRPEPTSWNSRLFRVKLRDGAVVGSGDGLELGFWQSENPLHNKPVAIEGDLSAAGMKFAIVTARWNAVITDRLLQGSLDALHRSGAARGDIEIVRVPGAWEVPSAARTLAETKRFDGIITLGCLIRGETAHYEAIYNEVARGIGQSQQDTGIPHAFGVLTCETLEQALDRAGIKAGNKGFEAAIAAIEMVSIQRKIRAEEGGR